LLDQTRSIVIGIVTLIMLMLFLLADGPPMLARMSAALGSDLKSTHALGVITAVRTELSCYYGALVSLKVVAARSKHVQPVIEFLSPEESKPTLLASKGARAWREVASDVGAGANRILGSGR
jgi:hypothetical protein